MEPEMAKEQLLSGKSGAQVLKNTSGHCELQAAAPGVRMARGLQQGGRVLSLLSLPARGRRLLLRCRMSSVFRVRPAA